MESRKIIIKSSEFNGVKTIMSSATTLAELKTDLDNAGISYRGMQFLEGISNTELKNDNSVLPHDVPYKGRVTNDLVFWLTKSEKNIASGLYVLSRQECYAYLKEHNLGEAVKEEFGRNYTQVDNLNLNAFINKHKNGSSKKEEPKKEEPKKPVKETKAKKANVNNLTGLGKLSLSLQGLAQKVL